VVVRQLDRRRLQPHSAQPDRRTGTWPAAHPSVDQNIPFREARKAEAGADSAEVTWINSAQLGGSGAGERAPARQADLGCGSRNSSNHIALMCLRLPDINVLACLNDPY